jgi:hypothetical protein
VVQVESAHPGFMQAKLSIINALGQRQELRSTDPKAYKEGRRRSLAVGHLPKGHYTLIIITNQKVVRLGFIKQ